MSAASPTSDITPPPDPFDARAHVLPAGRELHRVHGHRAANVFNPGLGGPTRFAPFTDPTDPTKGAVPTLYAAETDEAAVCETLLHDVPLDGGRLRAAGYRGMRESTVVLRRDVRLCALMGPGLRRLGAAPQHLTATDGDVYDRTVRWAEAAHRAGFEGLAWMSARENTSQAYMFFGDRVAESDLEVTAGGRGSFDRGESGFAWLAAFCALVKVELLLS